MPVNVNSQRRDLTAKAIAFQMIAEGALRNKLATTTQGPRSTTVHVNLFPVWSSDVPTLQRATTTRKQPLKMDRVSMPNSPTIAKESA